MSPAHACRTGCHCPAARGLVEHQAADEAQAAREEGTPVEAEVDRLRTRVRELEAELSAQLKATGEEMAKREGLEKNWDELGRQVTARYVAQVAAYDLVRKLERDVLALNEALVETTRELAAARQDAREWEQGCTDAVGELQQLRIEREDLLRGLVLPRQRGEG